MTVLIGDRKIRIPKPKLLTYDDYAKLTPPDNGNYELHKGQIICNIMTAIFDMGGLCMKVF